jgi:hypothetical protein
MAEATGFRKYEVRTTLVELLPSDYLRRRYLGLKHSGAFRTAVEFSSEQKRLLRELKEVWPKPAPQIVEEPEPEYVSQTDSQRKLREASI